MTFLFIRECFSPFSAIVIRRRYFFMKELPLELPQRGGSFFLSTGRLGSF